jgi:cytochrome c-type biogenesis protein CcmH
MVRARIAAGDADDEVRSYFRARYGDFVLLRPRLDAATAALWASPILLALIAIGAALLMRRGRISEGLAPDLEPDDR